MDFNVEMQDNGRITLPVELRREFGLKKGDKVTLRYEDGEVRLLTQAQRLDHIRRLLGPYLQGPDSGVDAFLAWRREEARRENEEMQRYDGV